MTAGALVVAVPACVVVVPAPAVVEVREGLTTAEELERTVDEAAAELADEALPGKHWL